LRAIPYILLLTLLSCSPTTQTITLTPETATAARGDTLTITTTTQDITWSVSSTTKTTTISPTGSLIIGNAETADTLIITATSTKKPKISGNTTITVQNPIKFGQGGGIIFYDKGEYTNGWQYLEAAPASYEFRAEWGLEGVACPTTTTSTRDGKANTETIIQLLNANNETEKAAQLCASLTINGLSDWYLPSIGELQVLSKYNMNADNIGGFNMGGAETYGYYWSSSSHSESVKYLTWYMRFNDSTAVIRLHRTNELLVRPIRTF